MKCACVNDWCEKKNCVSKSREKLQLVWARLRFRQMNGVPRLSLDDLEIRVRVETRTRENHGLGCSERASIVLVGDQEFLFPAFPLTEGDEVVDVHAQLFEPFFGGGRLETVYRVGTLPATQICGFGTGPDGSHGVSHPRQNLFSLLRLKLQLLMVATLAASASFEDIKIDGFGTDGFPTDGEGAALESTRIHTGLNRVFLYRDVRKSDPSPSFGLRLNVRSDRFFSFDRIYLGSANRETRCERFVRLIANREFLCEKVLSDRSGVLLSHVWVQ